MEANKPDLLAAMKAAGPWLTILGFAYYGTVLVVALFGVAWLRNNWGVLLNWEWWVSAYLVIGLVVGAAGGLLAFSLAWLWSVTEGRFWGFLLGWIPSGLLGGIVGLLLVPLWLPVLVVAGLAAS